MSSPWAAPHYIVPKSKKGEKQKEPTAKVAAGSSSLGYGCYHKRPVPTPGNF